MPVDIEAVDRMKKILLLRNSIWLPKLALDVEICIRCLIEALKYSESGRAAGDAIRVPITTYLEGIHDPSTTDPNSQLYNHKSYWREVYKKRKRFNAATSQLLTL